MGCLMLEVRSAKDLRTAGRCVSGYAAVFDETTTVGAFSELIRRGAFARSLQAASNICALYDHDSRALLGTTRAGTLSLREDERGLAFDLMLPDTSYGNDVAALVARGDIAGCSFGFMVREERWQGQLRELLDVDLVEITLTASPAYPQTSVSLRCFNPKRLFLDSVCLNG